jgi:ADP-glucose pyrophosphorylase
MTPGLPNRGPHHHCVLAFGGQFRNIDFTLSNCVNSGVRRVAVLTQ